MRKKILPVLLTLAMVLGMLPLSVFAAGEETAGTIQAKIDAATSAETINIDADTTEDLTIASGKDITLNINSGITLTNKAGHTITVQEGGKLTITGSGTVDNVTHGKGALLNEGTAILKGCTFTRSQETGSSVTTGGANSWYTIRNQKSGKLTIEAPTKVYQSGKFSSLICIYCEGANDVALDGSVTITGGEFDGGVNTITNKNGGTLTISGGTFKNTSQHVILNDNIANISGGTFTCCCFAHKLRKPFTQSAKKKKRLSGPFKTS